LKKKSIIVIAIIIIVLLVDQLVKIWVKTNFAINESRPIIPGFIQFFYIENPGMAFGTTLGDGVWAKYALSVFRFGAIIGIAIYIRKLIKENQVNMAFLITIALIFAGATGNLIDGMFYDYSFDVGVDPSISSNWVLNEFNMPIYGPDGEIVLRKSGFLLGSVVDMFQFTVKWPSWMPFGLGNTEIFSPIWNVADASISLGVIMIALRYRKFFKKEDEKSDDNKDEKEVVIS